MIRRDADVAITTSRWCELLGIPRPTWYRWKAAAQSGQPGKGPWPAPVVDAIEADAAKLAEGWQAWGHRKIHGLLAADGHEVSQASVYRALRRRGLTQPVNYQAERRELAKARKAAFGDPPRRRCRRWQIDFSEYETTNSGIWRMGGVVDYAVKPVLACTVTMTATADDAIGMLEAARERAEDWLGHPLIEEVVDVTTGEIREEDRIVIVSDNGPCFKAGKFAAWIEAQPEFAHVRTRHRAPETNGVIERFFQSIKYEHLYRHEIADGTELAREVDAYMTIYNTIRPHEALGFNTPAWAWNRTTFTPPNATPKSTESVSDS